VEKLRKKRQRKIKKIVIYVVTVKKNQKVAIGDLVFTEKENYVFEYYFSTNTRESLITINGETYNFPAFYNTFLQCHGYDHIDEERFIWFANFCKLHERYTTF